MTKAKASTKGASSGKRASSRTAKPAAQSPAPPPISLRLPATSANLGPAFDAAGLAMGMYLSVRAEAAEKDTIQATGRDAHTISFVPNHLILRVYHELMRREQRTIVPLALTLHNEIPLGKGCGSSAAARLAGVALAVHFGELGWDDDRIVAEASLLEGHPDNIAACWMGGLIISKLSPPEARALSIEMVRIRHQFKGKILLAVPEQPLATEEARRVLPTQYSKQDVIANIQNVALLVAAFAEGRFDLLASALDDRIHQPYRASLCPLLPTLKPLAGEDGVLGVALSGAGPSVLMLLSEHVNADAVKHYVAARLEDFHQQAELILTHIEETGGNASLRQPPAGEHVLMGDPLP